MSTPSGKPDVFPRHRSAKSSGNVQVKVAFPADAGAGTTETGSRIKGQTGKQDGCGTVGVSGNALRESGQGRQFGSVRHQREGRLVRLFDDRTAAVETEPRCRFILPQARRKPERRFAVAQGQGEIPPARAKGRPARTAGRTGQAAKPRGTGHGIEHNAEHPLHIEYGLGKGRASVFSSDKRKEINAGRLDGGGILPHPAGAFRFQRGEQFPIKGFRIAVPLPEGVVQGGKLGAAGILAQNPRIPEAAVLQRDHAARRKRFAQIRRRRPASRPRGPGSMTSPVARPAD